MAADRKNPVGNGADLPVKRPLHRTTGGTERLITGSRDQIGDRFRFGQGELSVQKRTLGELAGAGRGGPGFQHAAKDTAADEKPSVAGKLHHVLTGVAFRRTENSGDSIVDGAILIQNRPKSRRIAFFLGKGLPGNGTENLIRQPDGAVPGDADHADAAGSVGGGDRRNDLFGHKTTFLGT